MNAQDTAVLLSQAQDALKMHFIWMDRGYAFLRGQPLDLPAGFAKNDDLCPVGNWLRNRLDGQFRNLPLFSRTDKLHAEFHVVLDKLFGEKAGDVPRPIANRFNHVGDDLTRVLEEWIDLAKKHAHP